MRRILIFAGAGLGVLLILLVTLPFFIPSSVYKTQIEQAATDALGREVSISGNARISIFPGISASVEDVSVANPEGFEAEHMVEAGALRGSVRLWPLLSRRVEVSELSFEDASVMLTRRSDGVVNWEFGGAGDRTSDDAEPSAGGPFSASIDRARLRNATLVYEDLATGERYDDEGKRGRGRGRAQGQERRELGREGPQPGRQRTASAISQGGRVEREYARKGAVSPPISPPLSQGGRMEQG